MHRYPPRYGAGPLSAIRRTSLALPLAVILCLPAAAVSAADGTATTAPRRLTGTELLRQPAPTPPPPGDVAQPAEAAPPTVTAPVVTQPIVQQPTVTAPPAPTPAAATPTAPAPDTSAKPRALTAAGAVLQPQRKPLPPRPAVLLPVVGKAPESGSATWSRSSPLGIAPLTWPDQGAAPPSAPAPMRPIDPIAPAAPIQSPPTTATPGNPSSGGRGG